MITWFVLNSLITLLALVVLRLLAESSQKVCFYLAMFAVSLWLLPLQKLALPQAATGGKLVLVPLSGSDMGLPVVAETAPANYVPALFYLLATLGLGGLLFSVFNYLRLLARWRTHATDGSFLWERLPQPLRLQKVPIRLVPGLSGAMTTGWFRPKIWLKRELADTDLVRSLLVHEATHIRSADNFHLLLISLVRALLWWHPLVHLLCARARFFMETRCDRAACQQLTPGEYISQLAEAIYSHGKQPIAKTAFASAVLTHPKTNINRLKLLEKRSESMKAKHLLVVLVFLAGTTALVAFQDPPAKTEPKNAQALNSKEYKGHPIDINIKDSSIINLLRYIADEVGINMYVDASVEDLKVSYRFKQMPWDQVLDLVLSNANLGYNFENGALRIATHERLEKWDLKKAEANHARFLAEDTQLVTIKLEHAQAQDVAQILDAFLSARGRIRYDTRTNLIIMEEVSSRIKKMKSLVAKLDKPAA